MTPTEHALLAAILAAPDDDTPRLVYADWLEENAGMMPCGRCEGRRYLGAPAPGLHGWIGAPECDSCHATGRVSDGRAERAEFIRLQIKLYRAPLADHNRDMGYREWETLRRRERELLAHYAFDWFDRPEGLAAHYNPGTAEYGWLAKRSGEGARRIAAEFRRGFVESVTCTCKDWLAHGSAIVACQPVRVVRLSDREPLRTNGVFQWWASSVVRPHDWHGYEHHIPDDLYDLLRQKKVHGSLIRTYSTREDAVDDLSSACVAWARQEANLIGAAR